MSAALHRAWAKELDVSALYAILKLRVEVFVAEVGDYPCRIDAQVCLADGVAHVPMLGSISPPPPQAAGPPDRQGAHA